MRRAFRIFVTAGFFITMAVVAGQALAAAPGPVHWGRALIVGAVLSIPLVFAMRSHKRRANSAPRPRKRNQP